MQPTASSSNSSLRPIPEGNRGLRGPQTPALTGKPTDTYSKRGIHRPLISGNAGAAKKVEEQATDLITIFNNGIKDDLTANIETIESETLFGRDPQLNYELRKAGINSTYKMKNTGNASISRNHFQVRISPDGVIEFRDIGATFGSFKLDKDLQTLVKLESGTWNRIDEKTPVRVGKGNTWLVYKENNFYLVNIRVDGEKESAVAFAKFKLAEKAVDQRSQSNAPLPSSKPSPRPGYRSPGRTHAIRDLQETPPGTRKLSRPSAGAPVEARESFDDLDAWFGDNGTSPESVLLDSTKIQGGIFKVPEGLEIRTPNQIALKFIDSFGFVEIGVSRIGLFSEGQLRSFIKDPHPESESVEGLSEENKKDLKSFLIYLIEDLKLAQGSKEFAKAIDLLSKRQLEFAYDHLKSLQADHLEKYLRKIESIFDSKFSRNSFN